MQIKNYLLWQSLIWNKAKRQQQPILTMIYLAGNTKIWKCIFTAIHAKISNNKSQKFAQSWYSCLKKFVTKLQDGNGTKI